MVLEPLRFAGLALACAIATASPAAASGPSPTAPWYIDEYGGDLPDLNAWFDGRLGIIKPTAPRPMLFIDWRLLHARLVGWATGDALSTPCCGTPWWAGDYSGGAIGWAQGRAVVAGRENFGYLDTFRPGPDHTLLPNCFPDAFNTATAALKDLVSRYGATSPAVKAWLAAQDSVFEACHDPAATLPPPIPDAPEWLVEDRAYQEAALALYEGRNAEAAKRFSAIARDPRSPWRSRGLYLTARALVRQALANQTRAAWAEARGAVSSLASAPPDTAGRSEAHDLTDVLDFHENPAEFLVRREHELNAAAPSPQMAVAFRDYVELGETAATKPEALDWIDTVRARPAANAFSPNQLEEAASHAVARYESAREAALAHAVERWRAGRDNVWLLAALSLADPGEPVVPELLDAAERVGSADPAWLSVQYHVTRLTLASAPAAATRHRLDTILARSDLSVSDRNVFTAQRAQVAAGSVEFVRFALRRRVCGTMYDWDKGPPPPGCIRWRWDSEDVQPSGIYDEAGSKGANGLGEDARAVIDRAPLADRVALSLDRSLPAKLRLDIALTSYGRAVQLQDNAAIDRLARELEGLLPLMAEQFRAIPRARPGPDKRFAEFLVLAMIPGIRVDLADYVRPEGRRIADFQEYWTDWVILRQPDRSAKAPPLVSYQFGGAGIPDDLDGVWPDDLSDLTCLGECGRGAAPLRLPDFIARSEQASRERGWFFKTDHAWDKPAPPMPPGAVDVWDEMLTYARSHPADPRAPEALHWLVHVGHFGGSHDHSGHRAFTLLHARYPNSYWAKKTPYYND